MIDADYIVGELDSVFFENQKNYYKVLLISITETSLLYSEDKIVATGNFGNLQSGMLYRFQGKLVEHSKYGLQFQATSYQQDQPSSSEGLIRYLSSSSFPGVGKVLAERIVTALGNDAINKIIQNADVLTSVKGMTAKKSQMMLEQLQKSHGTEQAFIKLAEYGFTSRLVNKLIQVYKDKVLQVIEENPYQLIETITGFGFKRADQLADQIGFAKDAPERLGGALIYCLQEKCYSNGDTYDDLDALTYRAMELLSASRQALITQEQLAEQLKLMNEEGKLVVLEGKVFLAPIFQSEQGIARELNRLHETRYLPDYSNYDLDLEIDDLEKEVGIVYGASQRQAIKQALTSQVFILTGGPGTGKTTVLDGLVRLYGRLNKISLDASDYVNSIYPIGLAAPTGRAAKRMSESTGMEASTIHRLLHLTADDDYDSDFDDFMLEQNLLIVDEMSMVDTWLANRLFAAVPDYMQVILVGDQDQLPSVGPGQVLKDLLDTKAFAHVELVDIYRQAKGSTIVEMAHQMKKGKIASDFTVNKWDYSFFPCHIAQVESFVRRIVTMAIKKGYGANDIQVLAPMYKGQAGIDILNQALQEVFNPNPNRQITEIVHIDTVFRVGDKVLQLANQPENGVFNGDIGYIKEIFFANQTEDKVDQIVVAFDNAIVTYPRIEWQQLTLAYCTSIHKSQGSEYPIVILPVIHQYSRMLKRNLIYTAITRSKKWLIVLGEESAVRFAVSETGSQRQTYLKESIAIRVKGEAVTSLATDNTDENASVKTIEPEIAIKNYRLTKELIESFSIDPMIGMENIKP